jgi:hypothetical protein
LAAFCSSSSIFSSSFSSISSSFLSLFLFYACANFFGSSFFTGSFLESTGLAGAAATAGGAGAATGAGGAAFAGAGAGGAGAGASLAGAAASFSGTLTSLTSSSGNIDLRSLIYFVKDSEGLVLDAFFVCF